MQVIQDSAKPTEVIASFQNTAGSQKLAVQGDGALLDSSGNVRLFTNPTAKTIVDGAATGLFSVAVAQGSVAGGIIHFSVLASDGTDFQTINGMASYSSVNKAGTCTNTITYATANEAKAVSAGTLTLAFTMAEDTADVVTIKLQPTGSLTETTYTVLYTLTPLRGGAITIL